MKKYFKKIFSTITMLSLLAGMLSIPVYADLPYADFALAPAEEGNMTTSWNYYGNGSAAPVNLKDDLFDKAYRYMYIPGGNPGWTSAYMKFDLDIPERKAQDGIYVSFYYKAASTFKGTDDATYTSPASIAMNHIRDGKERLVNLQTQGLGDFAFLADDKWHKIEAYVPADGRFADNVLYIYNGSLATMDVLVADIKVGVVSLDNYNNDVAYTQMGWNLKKPGSITALNVSGQSLDLSGGKKEFNVSVEGKVQITAEGSDYITEEIEEDKYKVTAVAPGYNKALSDDGDVMYRERWNGSSYSGNINQITVKNSTLKGESYIINTTETEEEEVKPFNHSAPVTGKMTTSWNYANNGVVPPVELKNDLFDEAYRFMYIPGGNPAWTSVYMKFDLDIPERKSSDGMYVSFYYKAASSFIGTDGVRYTSDASIPMDHIRDGRERLVNLQTQGLGDFDFVADDQWHKIEAYVPAYDTQKGYDRFNDNALYIYNGNKATMDVLVADIRVGVLSLDSYNNDVAYTQMGWYLKELGEVNKLSVNGQELDISGDENEFTIYTDEMTAPEVVLDGAEYFTEKLSKDSYKITAVAPAYNKALPDDGDVMYRERWNGSGFGGNINQITVKNATLKGESFIVNLKYDEGFYVDGKKVEGAVPAGTVYCYKKSFDKPECGEMTAFIAAYEKGTNNLVDVSMQPYTFEEGETVAHVNVELTQDNSDDTLYFKVMILDNADNIVPLMAAQSTASISVE